MRLALAMIVRGTAEEAAHLNTCLSHSAKHVDKVFITLNAPVGEKIHPDCYKVCERYDAIVSEFEWNDDFSAARNFNFSQVPRDYDYILWLDADDALREGQVLRKAIEKEAKDGYSMWYQYDFDEYKRPYIVHQKIRVVRNDGSFEWKGRLHESLFANRNVSLTMVVGSDVLHLSSKKHFEENKERNLRIAIRGVEENPDDPRSFWNLGNAYHGNGMFEDALTTFATFLASTQSDEERYIAYLRVAEEYWNLGKQYEAIDQLRYAIGLRPLYPDAYVKMGALMVALKRYREAIQYLGQSLMLEPPQYTIVVFNPREYDYEPLRLLAFAHFELNDADEALKYFELCRRIYPKDKELKALTDKIREGVELNIKMKEKADLLSQLTDDDLKKELAALPTEQRSHPAICHLSNTRFIKTVSSGRDLVIFCGFTQHEWTPESAAKSGVGGSEEAVIHLARRWAERGWNVTVYNACGYKEQTFAFNSKKTRKMSTVTYKPFWSWNYRDRQDVVILWRHPMMAQYEINAGKILVDMHDVIPANEFTAERMKRIDLVCFKTHAHAEVYPTVPTEKARIIPNGIEPDQFTGISKKVKNLIINTSSPDRSLTALLDIFEAVQQRVPDARLEWAYGWENFDAFHGTKKHMMEWKAKMQQRMVELGVVERGRLNTADVADLYERGQIFLYPTGFYEIFCISAVKAQVAGAFPVCTDFAALKEVITWGYALASGLTPETWQKPYQFDFSIGKEKYPQLIEKVVEELGREPEACPIRDKIIEQYDWERVTTLWENEMK